MKRASRFVTGLGFAAFMAATLALPARGATAGPSPAPATKPTTTSASSWTLPVDLTGDASTADERDRLRQLLKPVAALSGGDVWDSASQTLTLPVTSEYLRAMEARRLLVCRRTARHAAYRINESGDGSPGAGLAAELRRAFQQDDEAAALAYRLATAFTHPRRIVIYRAIRQRAQTLAQLHVVTRISARALRRHLQKLQSRGFVTESPGGLQAQKLRSNLGRELARLAGS